MAKAREVLPHPDLYERDYYSWALEQAEHLRARRLAELDLDNLAEEVEDLARREAKELQSRCETLLAHLLKWEFQPEHRSHSWAGTIRRERGKIAEHLADNPGLKSRCAALFARAFGSARADASIETNLPVDRFPAACPYSYEQAMDAAFWPGPEQPRP
jgi:Domain of unknown function DUF29